jgi:hypothetical protein
MKATIGAAAFLVLAATAQAQTDTTASTPAAIAEAPTQCPDLPPDPAMPDGAHIRMSSMTAASDAYKAWVESARAVLECRRLQYNAVIARSNALSVAWNAQIDAFCGRRDVHCEPVQNQAPQAAMPPAH